MKKIIVFITSLVICFSLCCVNVFAASASTVPFSHVLELQYSQVYQLEYGVDYEDYDGNSYLTVGVVPTQETIAQGGIQYQAWNCIISYEGPDIKPYETVKFRLSWKMESSMPRPFSFREVVVRDYSKSQWDFAGQQSVGKISFTTGTPDLYSCYSNISYTNTTNETLTSSRGDNPLTFELCFKGSKPAYFYSQIQFFDANVTDFFVGDLSSAESPKYEDPSESLGSSVEDYNNQEDVIRDDAQSGIDDTVTFFKRFNLNFAFFTVFLSAITNAFEYVFDGSSLLVSIIQVSLAIGVFAYILNLVAVYIRGRRRE